MTSDYTKHRERLYEITLIRDENGNIPRDSDICKERESLIKEIVETLTIEKECVKTGIVSTNIGWKSPVIKGLRKVDCKLEETGQRIAWELYPEQFNKKWVKMIIGCKNDPFYDNGEVNTLSDTEKIMISMQKASAERKYRDLLKNLRNCYRTTSNQQESPAKEQ